MRIRTVKPDYWEDEKIACLSRDARLMFIGCFNLADDEGLLRWTPAYIKSGLFMYDDDLDIAAIGELMAEVASHGLVLEYSPAAVKGSVKQKLAWIIKFRVHQKINRPQASKLSPPSLQNRAVQSAYAQRDGYICHLCKGPVNEQPHYVGDPYSVTEPEDISSLNASLDHLNPRTKGGGDHPTNVSLAHIGCNKARRERPISQFKVPASVRAALISIGWVSDHDVNDSVNGSVNRSLLEEEGEREGDEEREAEKDDVPLPPEPPPGPYDSAPVVVDTAPASIEVANKPTKRQPSSAAKTVVRQELGSNTYPTDTVDRLAVQVQKLIREDQPDALIREALREWDRRPNCSKPEYLPTVLSDVIKVSRSNGLTAGEAKVIGWAELGKPSTDQRKAIGQ